ncbi:FAR1-related sequence 5-like protein [Tanacetum coccineum]
MSDSEDSTVTYTAVSSPFEDGSDIGSPGVDGPPIMPEDPYAYIMAAYQVPPSPDYIPGPEEPQSPPPLDFVPEPMYPEYIPQEDEILPAEEQPLPAAASPTADSPGYVPESDPEEEPEEDDEDPEEDPADYPADRDDDDDDEKIQFGEPDGSGSSKNTSSKKTGCPFKLVGKYSFEQHYWTIRVVCDQHNHRPTEHLEAHAYARRLSDDEFRLVEDLTWKNVPPHEILSTLKDQDENNLSTLPTIYDAQKKIRKVERDGKTPMQVLMSLLHTNRYVYQPYIHPVTNELQALFFVYPTSYEIWRAFPHVLIIDA